LIAYQENGTPATSDPFTFVVSDPNHKSVTGLFPVTISSVPAGLAAAYYQAILRTPPSARDVQLDTAELNIGSLTPAQLLTRLLSQAQQTTIPALLSYDFMIGLAPGSSGIDYLTGFAAALQSGNYTYDGGFLAGSLPGQYNTFQFSVLNTYVNFCATEVAVPGSAFAAAYGSLAATVSDTNRTTFFDEVYQQIFNFAPDDGTVAQFVTSEAADDPTITTFQYYVNYAGSELGGYGAIAGVLLSAAETPPNQYGAYPNAVQTFLTTAAVSGAAGGDTAPYGSSLLTTSGASIVGGTSVTTDLELITVSNPDQLVDPGTGDFTIRFISGSGGDTLVLHNNSVDQVSGFDVSTDVLDINSLLREANVNLGSDTAALGDFLRVVDQGGDAQLLFDRTGLGGGSAIAVLQGVGGVVTGLATLTDHAAIKLG
jgi:hypothetical protein